MEAKLSDLERVLTLLGPTFQSIDSLARDKAKEVSQTDFYSSMDRLENYWRGEYTERLSYMLADFIEKEIKNTDLALPEKEEN